MKRADESVPAVPQQPALLRWSYAAGSFGIWGPLVAFALHRTGAYVIYLGADATAIGTIGIIMGWWNALNGPFVARLSDAGSINRCMPCFANWGRRAPWLLLGTPIVILGTTLMWLPPAYDRTTLAAWYAFCYFLVINGGTANLQSFLAGIAELEGTGDARARQLAMQQPFIVASFLVGGVVVPLIAYTFTPEVVPHCCFAEVGGHPPHLAAAPFTRRRPPALPCRYHRPCPAPAPHLAPLAPCHATTGHSPFALTRPPPPRVNRCGTLTIARRSCPASALPTPLPSLSRPPAG